ncbi:MAG TPA: ABC transporter ATP-binding protein [Actinomycetes bacterium]|nr:ABC transporter ATP-binding protein [Actinomycetes bacterium]
MTAMHAPVIALRDVRKAYGGSKAVDGIDLTIAPGEVVALLGPNGAGKSTTLDIVLGLGRADSGAVELFGGSPAEAIAAGKVGAMLQTGGLIMNTTVRELIGVMASLYSRPREVDRVLELTGLAEVADKQANKLSGGQTQRVRFAIAMVSDPDLLILDEPTAALDVQARHAFWDAIRGYAAEGRTVVFATHYLEEADEFADRIVLMAQGRIVADGSATEVKSIVDVRTIRATLPDIEPSELLKLPGVTGADRRGDSIVLACSNSDEALRALLPRYQQLRDIEVRGGGLDEAFRQLVGDGAESVRPTGSSAPDSEVSA